LLDDHAPWLFYQEAVALAHLAAGAPHIIESSRIVLRGRRHESALQLRRRRTGRPRRQLNRRRRYGRLSNRLLRRSRTRWLLCRTQQTALILLLLR
jgi:hypothetical protein